MEQAYKTSPRPYQRTIVERTFEMPALALYLKQGLGKTKVCLDTAAMRFLSGLDEALIVVSKGPVVENWLFEEIPVHLSVPHTAHLYSTRTKNRIPPVDRWPQGGLKVLLINDGCLRTPHGIAYVEAFVKKYKCGLVIDESTIIKNPTAQITKRIVKLGEKTTWRRILSGEPAPQGPVDYYSQYKFLSPAILGVKTFTAYKNIFCEQDEMWINGRKIMRPTQAFNPIAQQVFEDSVKPYTIRLRKEDVLTDLPAKQYIVRKYELPPATRKMYDKLKNEFLTELVIKEGTQTEQVTALMAIARITRLHQIVSGHAVADSGEVVPVDSGRLEALFAILDERPPESKTIIWAHYRHSIDELESELEARYGAGSCRKVYGGIPTDDRQQRLSDFKRAPEVRHLIANPASCAWGLTLTESDTAIYYSNSYNWEHRDQSEDRIHRIGQTADSVTYYDLVAEKTVDERIIEVLQSKAEFSSSVMKELGKWFT